MDKRSGNSKVAYKNAVLRILRKEHRQRFLEILARFIY